MIMWPCLHHGDSQDVLKTIPDNTADALITDPPAGVEVLHKKWDSNKGGRDAWVEWMASILAESKRVCTPSARGFIWSLPKTSHWTAQAIDDSGWIIDGVVSQVTSMGMPKGPLDLAKSIDKMKHDIDELLVVTSWVRKQRDRSGLSNSDIDRAFGSNGMSAHWCALSKGGQPLVPALDQIPKLLQLFSLDESDVPDEIKELLLSKNANKWEFGQDWKNREVVGQHEVGPMVATWFNKYTEEQRHRNLEPRSITETSSERAKKWEGWATNLKPSSEYWFLVRQPGQKPFDLTGKNAVYTSKATVQDACRAYNKHPTVKHTGLMFQLVDMITETGSVVLDPFMGSGTTGVACGRLGRRFLGIEKDEKSFQISIRRIVDQADARKAEKPLKNPARRKKSYVLGKKTGSVL